MAYSDAHLYFDDLPTDGLWTSLGRTITEADLTTFAAFSGDHNPMHTDAVFAANTPFGKVMAHGMGVFGIASGLATTAPPVRTVALLGIRDWEFLEPVFPGDTIHLESRIVEKTVKGRGKRGEIVWHRRIVNQHGKTMQQGHVVTLVECRKRA